MARPLLIMGLREHGTIPKVPRQPEWHFQGTKGGCRLIGDAAAAREGGIWEAKG